MNLAPLVLPYSENVENNTLMDLDARSFHLFGSFPSGEIFFLYFQSNFIILFVVDNGKRYLEQRRKTHENGVKIALKLS